MSIFYKPPGNNAILSLSEIDELNNKGDYEKYIKELCAFIKQQQEQTNNLYDILYKIAPDLEIIETMADSEEELQEYIDKYMNHGEY